MYLIDMYLLFDDKRYIYAPSRLSQETKNTSQRLSIVKGRILNRNYTLLES